ncbi:MAG: hypothetical protein F4Y74_01130 [Gemmatimonadales bacterium]|nr:hypothetical protein [Gemmatimonadales bacterium]MYG19311.1 hypothetical protein [Gemmatimonadales bacterium]
MRANKSPDGSFDRILASLHATTLDEARWPETDRLIAEISGASSNGLGLFSGTSQADGTGYLIRISLHGQRRKDWERRYFEDYWPEDERIPRIARQAYGRMVPTGDLYADAEKKTSPAYNEILLETRMQQGLNMRLKGTKGLNAVIWIVGDPVERGGWRSDQIRLIQRLQPHIRQFALVSHALSEADLTGTTMMELLATPRFGVIHLDRRGRIMRANDRALEILREGDALMDRDGFLRTRMPDEHAELSRLMALALPPWGVQGSAGSMTVTAPSSSPPGRLALHFTPVGDDYPHFRTRRLGAMVLVVDPAGRSLVDPVHVAAALDLTSMESELAVALAAGRTVQDIARRIGRTEATVRWHVKQIYRKQGISRQVDLVRRVLSLEGFGGTRP